MKQVRKLKLSQLSKNELEKKELKKLKGGGCCICGGGGGSANASANIQEIFILRVVDMDGVTNLF